VDLGGGGLIGAAFLGDARTGSEDASRLGLAGAAEGLADDEPRMPVLVLVYGRTRASCADSD
jgi:hypothetical protein